MSVHQAFGRPMSNSSAAGATTYGGCRKVLPLCFVSAELFGLSCLQNHQLTTELEYQSKQTEQLLFRNNKMKVKIETLNREIQIHREVEKELAKRSHFCQKVIKRLKQ